MKTFRTYMVVGGMPQALEAFVNSKTFSQIDFMKRNILRLYEEDLSKYDSKNRQKASVVYRTIPEQLENMAAQMLRASGNSLYFHEYLYTPANSIREKNTKLIFSL